MRAIEIYTDMGRFTIAAKHHISIAEIYETELVDIEKAIAHYEQSADYYKGEESNSSANKCLLKVAGYAAQLEQYQKAIDIYEQVGAGGAPGPALRGGHGAPSCLPVRLPSLTLPGAPRSLHSRGLPHALTLYSAWLSTLSTHDPTRRHRPLPTQALPTLLTGHFPGGPRVRPALKNQSRGESGKNCEARGSQRRLRSLLEGAREGVSPGYAGSPLLGGEGCGGEPGRPGGLSLARRKAGSWPRRSAGRAPPLMFPQPATPLPTDVPASCRA
eukprot:XP_028341783.1 alpha-soluble NSF attachment protein isoform X3 [Physeter catodon]